MLDAISRATTPTASCPGAIRAVWSLTIQHFYWCLLFDLEFGGLLVAQLRVLETV